MAAAATIGSPALAQDLSAPGSTPVTTRTDVSLSVEALYDSNVARSSAAEAELRGLHPSDVTVIPTLALNLARPVGPESVFLNGTVAYYAYDRNHILDTERVDMQAGGNFRLKPCTGTVTGGYGRHQSDLQDVVLASAAAVRNIESRSTVEFDGACPRAVGLTPSVTVSEEWDDNSAEVAKSSNYRSLNAIGGLTYSRPSIGQLSIYGKYTQTDFPDRALPDGSNDGFKVYSGGLVYARKFGSKVNTTLSVYDATVSIASPIRAGATQTAFSGAIYSADLAYQPTHRLLLHLNYARTVSPSNRLDVSYAIDATGLAEVTYRLGARSGFTLGASRGDNHYQQSALNLQPTLDLSKETVRTFYGIMRYNLTRRISINLDVRREDRHANIAAYVYGSTRIGLTTIAAF